jgi:hypothetical protein
MTSYRPSGKEFRETGDEDEENAVDRTERYRCFNDAVGSVNVPPAPATKLPTKP